MRNGLTLIALALILPFGFQLRRGVSYLSKEFKTDRAFHYRMTREVLDKGRVPQVDRLSEWPSGRKIPEILPTGMYTLASYYHKISSRFLPFSLRESILSFSGLVGCLISLPIFFILKIIKRSNLAALSGAFLSVFIPAYLLRSFCGWFKFEAVGTLFIFSSLAFFIGAVNGRDFVKTVLLSCASCFFMIMAFACWRLTVVYLLCLDFFMILTLLLQKKENFPLNTAFTILGIGTVFSSLFIHYLRTSNFIFSRISILTAGLILAIYVIPVLIEKFPRLHWKRRSLAALLLILLFGIVVVIPERGTYAGVLSYVKFRIYEKLGIMMSSSSIDRILAYTVIELWPYTLRDIWGYKCLSASFAFLILIFALPGIYRDSQIRQVKVPWGSNLIFFLTAVFFVLTLLSRRNKVVLGPLASVIAGMCVFYPVNYFFEYGKNRTASLNIISVILLAGYAFIFFRTGYESRCIKRMEMGIAPYNLRMISWIAENTPAEAVILAYWDQGYQVQTYARRATLTDGFLESETNKKRILKTAEAFYSQGEDQLYRFCQDFSVDFVVLRIGDLKMYARILGVTFSNYISEEWLRGGKYGFKVTPLGKSVTAIKMAVSPEELRMFKLRAAFGDYLIFAVIY